MENELRPPSPTGRGRPHGTAPSRAPRRGGQLPRRCRPRHRLPRQLLRQSRADKEATGIAQGKPSLTSDTRKEDY